MTQEKLREVLEAHNRWLNSVGKSGEKADLSGANLRYADLHGADLRGADLSNADLYGANIINADLSNANLRYADLREADLRGADLDYSCLPLSCGSLQAHFDDRQLKQIAYHLVKAGLHSQNASEETKRELEKLIDFANGFHRAKECGIIKKPEQEEKEE